MIRGPPNRGGRTILTSVGHGWFQKRLINSQVDPTLANTAVSYYQASDGTYFGDLLVSPNGRPEDEYLVLFHTDDPENPRWVALRTQWEKPSENNPHPHGGYFSKPLGFWDDDEEFLFFEPSDFQGSGTGAETWGLLSGVLAGEKRIYPKISKTVYFEGRYVNNGFERYQAVLASVFRAAINRAKI